ncbi:unnamed protein product [Trypanosoma congolense IL3000]|uniref:WGS project CAEQ00000000 data, annotated contig 2320 n=1 Tax=Trypanosoma congolense (strain IL3000) TaxID=1068625 RepID=F9WD49_TRYCI|nr:unnamed protein product [Trypanosoma congolense IL3000]
MMKLWIVALVMSFGGLCATAAKFNAEEHDALCNVLVAAVELWDIEESPESELPSALKTAINQAIFGKEKGGNLEDLYEALPDVYEHPGDREQWCGKCSPRYQRGPYPGKSIPHDLMCLCTPGKEGTPFPRSSSWSRLLGWKRITLCGQRRWELIEEGHVGWYSLTYGSAMCDLRKP